MLTRLFYIVLLILIATDGWGQLESTAAICGATQQIETPRTADMFNHNGAGHSGSITVNPANTESNSLFNILDTSLWPARWDCGVWSPEHGWLYIISDLSIWLAYFAIPFILAFFYYRRKREIPYKTVFILFIGFIIACGLTHLIDAIIFWWPAYKLSAMLRLGTALVSWGTVFGLVKIIPKALELKGPESLQKIIDAKTDELKQINTALNEEVTKRKKAEQRLEKLNASLEDTVNQRTTELESINKELNAFSYSVSHDLRSPLRSISGFSQALKEDYFDQLDASGKNYLERISNAAIRMGKLIDDLLNLSRISRTDVVKEQIDLTKLCKKIINETLPDPKYKFKIGANLTVTGDIKLIKILMENLIGNAIKYSSKIDKPTIEIGEEIVEEKGPAFFIKDNGAGFDSEYSDKLFGAFQRLHSAEEFEGTGIGLATVKRIVNMHGGRIWAEGSINNGATFYFNLNN